MNLNFKLHNCTDLTTEGARPVRVVGPLGPEEGVAPDTEAPSSRPGDQTVRVLGGELALRALQAPPLHPEH